MKKLLLILLAAVPAWARTAPTNEVTVNPLMLTFRSVTNMASFQVDSGYYYLAAQTLDNLNIYDFFPADTNTIAYPYVIPSNTNGLAGNWLMRINKTTTWTSTNTPPLLSWGKIISADGDNNPVAYFAPDYLNGFGIFNNTTNAYGEYQPFYVASPSPHAVLNFQSLANQFPLKTSGTLELTNSAAVDIVLFNVASNTFVGGVINYSIVGLSATTNQVASGQLLYSATAFETNVVTSLDDNQGTVSSIPAGSVLTWTWAANVATNNVVVLNLNAVSDLTLTNFKVSYVVQDNLGTAATKF